MKEYDYARHSSLVQSTPSLSGRSGAREESFSRHRRGSDADQITVGRGSRDQSPLRQPLQYSNAFRILKVHAGKWDAPIECNLLVRRLRSGGSSSSSSSALQESEAFDALSYHWGSKKDGYYVKILAESEAFHIKIRPNLDSALRHLREEEIDVYLWVDALCINQKDNDEKSAQIPLLHFIYNQAENVRVWIGKAEDDSDRAMDFVEGCLNMKAFDRLVLDPIASENWAALSALMRRPWFSRRWVIQEIAHARVAVLHCGSKQIAWRDFASAVSMLSRRQPQLRKLFRESAGYGNHPDYLGDLSELGAVKLAELSDNICRKLEDGTITEKMFSLEALVSSLTTFEASDPHDILYAILWLANDAHPVTKNAYRLKAQQPDDIVQPPTPATTAQSPAEPVPPTFLETSDGGKEKFPEFREELSNGYLLPTLPANRHRRSRSEAPRARVQITLNEPGSNGIANATLIAGTQERGRTEATDSSVSSTRTVRTVLEIDPIAPEVERISRGRPVSMSITSNMSRMVQPRSSLSTTGVKDREKIATSRLLERLQSSRITVDYNKSVFEVCKDFVEFAIRKTKSLDMLCKPWAPTNLPVDEILPLPTWMPQLSGMAFAPTVNGIHRRVNADPLVGTPGFPAGGPKPYRACGNLRASASFSSDNPRTLQVQGFVLDRIRERKALATGGNIPAEWMAAANWKDVTQLPPDLFWNTLVGNRDATGRLPPRYWQTSCRDAFQYRPFGGALNTTDILLNFDCPTLVAEFVERVQCMVWNRRLILLEHLSRKENPIALALGPGKAKKGDLICILHGCSVPVVLRKFINDEAEVKRKKCKHLGCPSCSDEEHPSTGPADVVHYELIGACYVHGMMNGEAITTKQDGRPIQEEWFDLR